jgi:hypothetical protein
MRWTALCSTIALLMACDRVGNAEKEKRMERSGSVLDLVPRLAEKLPFRQEDVGKLTGVTLKRDDKTSNSSYDIYRSTGPADRFTAVEVRQRVQAKAGKNGIVILDLAKGPCIRQKDAKARFGEPAGMEPPSPHGPADEPTYLTYKQSWGELRLGFTNEDVECLVSIVLDAT